MRDAAEARHRRCRTSPRLAALLADPARCKVLLALDDGRALRRPASSPTKRVSAGRPASSHLGKLTDAGLLAVRDRHGRHRYYRLAGAGSRRVARTAGAAWHRRGPSGRCEKAPARRGCARRAPATTTRRGPPRRRQSWATCWTGRCSSAATAATTPTATATTPLSSPGHDLRYELTDTGRGLSRRGIGIEITAAEDHSCATAWTGPSSAHHLSGGTGPRPCSIGSCPRGGSSECRGGAR